MGFSYAGESIYEEVPLQPLDIERTELTFQPGYVEADEQSTFKFNLHNLGPGTAYGVEMSIEPRTIKGLTFQSGQWIGEIPPDSTKHVEVVIRGDHELKKGNVEMTLTFTERYGFDPDPINVSFPTIAFRPPALEIAGYGTETGLIRKGREEMLTILIQNKGSGKAKGVEATVTLGENIWTADKDKVRHYPIGELNAGEYKNIDLSFWTNKRAKVVDIQVSVRDETGLYGIPTESLDLPLERIGRRRDDIDYEEAYDKNKDITEISDLTIEIHKHVPSARKENPLGLAVIIGIERYRNLQPVRYASMDALWFEHYTRKTLGFLKENVKLLISDEATEGEIENLLDPKYGWLAKNVKKGKSEIIVYFAGHGIPSESDSRGYLAAADNYAGLIGKTQGIPLEKLAIDLESLGAASTTLFLDACFSGITRDGTSIQETERMVGIRVPIPTNINLFTASKSDQVSQSSHNLKHGVFSYYLMMGLRGNADKDKNKRITLEELGKYVQDEVSTYSRRELDKEQKPEVNVIEDIEFVRVSW